MRGNPAEALKDYQQALEIGRRNKATMIEARALINIGGIREDLDEFREAIPNLEAALKLYESARSLGNSLNARILLQRAWQATGDFQKADSYLQKIAGELQPGRDDLQIMRLEEETASLRNDQGRFREAISHWERSYLMNETRSDPYGMGVAVLGKAASLWQLGDYPAANQLLEQASTIARERGFSALAGGVLAEQFKIALSRQDIAGIERHLMKMQDRDERVLELQILKGLTLGRRGARETASPACQELLGRLAAQPQLHLKARAQLTCAEVALEAGDRAKSEGLAMEARKFYSQNLCHEAGWRASVLLALSRPGAQPDADRAEEDLRILKRDWTPEDMKRYLNRRDIRRLYLKLDKIKQDRL